MSTMGKKADIEYWSTQLEEASARAAEFTTKYQQNKFTLNYEDMFVLVGIVGDLRSYSTLLAQTVAQPDDPKSLIQRIRNK